MDKKSLDDMDLNSIIGNMRAAGYLWRANTTNRNGRMPIFSYHVQFREKRKMPMSRKAWNKIPIAGTATNKDLREATRQAALNAICKNE